jgi:uncharacterized CHY-type Zn-finger protein
MMKVDGDGKQVGQWSKKTKGVWKFRCCDMYHAGLERWTETACYGCGKTWTRPPISDGNEVWVDIVCVVCGEPATYKTHNGVLLCDACEEPERVDI